MMKIFPPDVVLLSAMRLVDEPLGLSSGRRLMSSRSIRLELIAEGKPNGVSNFNRGNYRIRTRYL
jgi:hypothetical protein